MDPKPRKKRNKWLVGIGLFFLVYLLGGVILQVALIATGYSDKYVGYISLAAGVIVFLYHTTKVPEDETNAQI